jgi:GTP cyclohydrolase IA
LTPEGAMNQDAIASLTHELLVQIGEDPEREGLKRTPERVARAYEFLTRGYHSSVEEILNNAVFEEECDEMVVVKDIELYSLCEHHMLPFTGRAHVAYVPDGRIVGLSKIPRIVEMYSRRLQVQERLTFQVAKAIEEAIQPKGVGVVVEAAHLCMMMRGVEKQNSKAVTSCMLGRFRSDQRTRAEFLNFIHA